MLSKHRVSINVATTLWRNRLSGSSSIPGNMEMVFYQESNKSMNVVNEKKDSNVDLTRRFGHDSGGTPARRGKTTLTF